VFVREIATHKGVPVKKIVFFVALPVRTARELDQPKYRCRVKQQTGKVFFLIDFLMAFTCIDEMRIMGQNV
jgi:hypothetical protein